MAYFHEMRAGDQIVVPPCDGPVVFTLLDKSGKKARIRVESDEDFHLEHSRSEPKQARQTDT